MLRAKEYRKRAWENLRGKWGTMALCALIVSLISAVCGGLSVIGVGAIALLVLSGSLTLGTATLALAVERKKAVAVEMQFSGFKMFAKSFVLYVINGIFTFLWTLLFIIPGIVKVLSYSMSYYIMLDDPSIAANDARKKSMEMMRGHKWRLFCLELSFIGWALLSILTLGILMFWIQPYMQCAIAAFYQSLLPEKAENDAPVDPFATQSTQNDAPADDASAQGNE